jgi:Leucine-rich repeat (LRR) protein
VLQLQYTNIASLPASIGNLNNLVSLGVYNFETGDIVKINDFDVFYGDFDGEDTKKRSPFKSLPSTAANLVSLENLNLNNTEVSELPDFLGDLPALEMLQIVDCDIETIPPSIQSLVESGSLDLVKDEVLAYYGRMIRSFDRKKRRRR